MELEAKKMKMFDHRNKSKEVNVIKKLSFDITTYPDFDIKDLCLCGEEGCKKVELYVKVFVNVTKSELFTLLGLMEDREAVLRLEDTVPMKVSFETDVDKLAKRCEEMKVFIEKSD